MVLVKTGYTSRVSFDFCIHASFRFTYSLPLCNVSLHLSSHFFTSAVFYSLFLNSSSDRLQFFLDGCISISLRTVSFPGGSWSLQAWMFDYYILPVFCVCSSLAPLLTRAVPFFSVFVTARNTFHVRLWHPAMTAPSVSWRLWRVLVSICYPVLRVANHVLSGTEPPGHFFQACHVDGRKFLPKKRRNCSTF